MAPNLDIFMTTFPYGGKFFLAEEYFFMVLAADLRNKILPFAPKPGYFSRTPGSTPPKATAQRMPTRLPKLNRRRVALAVDDSPNAMRAVRFAARDIVDADSDAVLITAVHPGQGNPGKEGQRVLDHHKAQLLRCGLAESRISTITVKCKDRESIGDAVCKTVKRQNCDHVVLGSRGLSSVQQNVLHLVGLGSVGEHVAHNAHVPVTIVPPITPVEEMITVRGARVGVKRKK